MHLHDPRPEKSLDQAAKESNEADSEALPETFVDHAEAVWRKLENQTQQEVANDLGWSRSMVKQYAALKRINDDAWQVIGTTISDSLLVQVESSVPKNGTTVPFTEGLLRDIVALTDEQQYKLVAELADSNGDAGAKKRFKKQAQYLRQRNEALEWVLSEVHDLPDEYSERAQEHVESGNYDKAWDNGPDSTLRNLVTSLRSEHDKKARVQIKHGDFRQLMPQDYEEGSIDLIFTDPPYGDDAVDLYADLARVASTYLKDGGSLLCYAGQHTLPEVIGVMAEQLRYWWCIATVHNGGNQVLHGKGVRCGWKPILWFVKGSRGRTDKVRDIVRSGDREKAHHEWQQSRAEAYDLIKQIALPGEHVVDPFAGSGTSLLAANDAECTARGYEIDAEHYNRATERINSEVSK